MMYVFYLELLTLQFYERVMRKNREKAWMNELDW